MIKKWICIIVLTCFSFSPHLTFATDASSSNDPFESFNRSMFGFNEFMDRVLLKPIALIYQTIIPKPIKMGISNFFDNLDLLPTIANDLLQGEFKQSANDAWRFAINSTVGVYGLIDVASAMNLKKNHQDFGLTLAKHGYRDSTYLVLPFWGPLTTRDLIGKPIDYFAFSVYPRIHPERDRYTLYGLSIIDARARLLRYNAVYDSAALDRYTFVRDAYLQRQAHLIEGKNDQHDF